MRGNVKLLINVIELASPKPLYPGPVGRSAPGGGRSGISGSKGAPGPSNPGQVSGILLSVREGAAPSGAAPRVEGRGSVWTVF